VDDKTASSLADLHSVDHRRQDNAYQYFMAATDEPIDWAYDVWADLLATLKTGENRQRAIAAQVLCGLAKSDPELRMVKDLPALLAVTKDERFVTARHCMQSLWKIGVEGEKQRTALMKGLQARFKECATEKNCSDSLRHIGEHAADLQSRERGSDSVHDTCADRDRAGFEI